MRKSILIIGTLLALTLVLVAAVFDLIPSFFWSAKEFSNPTYYRQLRQEWAQKPSSFLLQKLHSIDPMRFSIAANVLVDRNERKAISVLNTKAKSNYIDTNIHFSACSALAQISPSIAKNVLFDIVKKYKNGKSIESPEGSRYRNALRILASMKDERIYPIVLQMAKSDDRLEREFALDGALYYFDNHGKELLPLYLDYLNSKESYKGQVIKEIKGLNRSEAIPTLEEFALNNRAYEEDANEAIQYLKGLQK